MHNDDDDLFPLLRPMREEGDRLDESEWSHPLEEQWNVQEFCLNAMERAIPLLSGLDMMIYSKCLRLVSSVATLLKRSVDKRNLWQHRDHHDNFVSFQDVVNAIVMPGNFCLFYFLFILFYFFYCTIFWSNHKIPSKTCYLPMIFRELNF